MKNNVIGWIVSSVGRVMATSLVLVSLCCVQGLSQVKQTTNVNVKLPTLSLDAIIEGIEKNQKVWLAQKSWLVRYTHMREKMNMSAVANSPYMDNEVVNARKGSWLFLSENQLDTPGGQEGRQTWAIWKDKQYTNRDHSKVILYGSSPPEAANLFFGAFFYPAALMRDFLSDTLPIPKGLEESPEWGLNLPRCLQNHRAEYHIRPKLEVVDNFPCYVLERDGNDIIWIDAQNGFNVRRRRAYYSPGRIAYEGKESGWKERVPGVWLPDRQIAVSYNPDNDPMLAGMVKYVISSTLLEARFNDIPDSLFDVPTHFPKGTQVIDARK